MFEIDRVNLSYVVGIVAVTLWTEKRAEYGCLNVAPSG